MKRAATLLALALSLSSANAEVAQVKTQKNNPYMGQNVTRTYYLSDLEGCAGILDMQSGDLWTITFPENITSFFLTRSGVVEAKSQDNRLLLAGLSGSGSVPLVVLTESAQAPKFIVSMQPGKGGQVKDVQILSGTPPSSNCPDATATRRNTAPSAVPVPGVVAPSTLSNAAPTLPPGTTLNPGTPSLPAPVPVQADPIAGNSPVMAAKAPAAPTATPVQTTPKPTTTDLDKIKTRFKSPAIAGNGVASAYLPDMRGVTVKMVPVNTNQLRLEMTNTLSSSITFKTSKLSYGGVGTTEDIVFNVNPRQTVTKIIPMQANIILKQGPVTWPGSVTKTGEVVILRGKTNSPR